MHSERCDVPSAFVWAEPRPAKGILVVDAPVADKVGSVLMAARQRPRTGYAHSAARRSDRRWTVSVTAGLSRGMVLASCLAAGGDPVPLAKAPPVAASQSGNGRHSTAVGRRTRCNERTRGRDGERRSSRVRAEERERRRRELRGQDRCLG